MAVEVVRTVLAARLWLNFFFYEVFVLRCFLSERLILVSRNSLLISKSEVARKRKRSTLTIYFCYRAFWGASTIMELIEGLWYVEEVFNVYCLKNRRLRKWSMFEAPFLLFRRQ